ncbi:toll/interleukin-1 receptor domain-containing protein [Pseudonocardia humida]|uniref:Toll/interleukin-1 receptor domain-containing protein n=1 Tax=Pseudonocardia humida TaxID=2800819 RepID=A0ABT1A9J9_9PSEU|nr:toll/interleukin-1 receptor domain-containing protein [Pseudonocardia humida]
MQPDRWDTPVRAPVDSYCWVDPEAKTRPVNTGIVGNAFNAYQWAPDPPWLGTPTGPAFLCHSSGDKQHVRRLYHHLVADGIRCWFDERDLIPGQDWDLEIRRAIKAASFVVACLSRAPITKAGYIHRELRFALDRADEQPHDSIFIIPVRLEECEVPERLTRIHRVDLFAPGGYENLLRALRYRPAQ